MDSFKSLSEQVVAEVYLQLLALPLMPNDEIRYRLVTTNWAGSDEYKSYVPLTDAQVSYVELLIERTRDKVTERTPVPDHLYGEVMSRRLGFSARDLDEDE